MVFMPLLILSSINLHYVDDIDGMFITYDFKLISTIDLTKCINTIIDNIEDVNVINECINNRILKLSHPRCC